MFPIWKVTGCLRGLLLNPPGFDVDFFIVGIDVIHTAFRANPVGSVFPCLEGAGGGVFSGHHSGTQGRVFRKERLAAALGQRGEEEGWPPGGKESASSERYYLFQKVVLSSWRVVLNGFL